MDYLYFICPVCHFVLQVTGDRGELARIPEIVVRLARTCVTDNCIGRMQASVSMKLARTSQQSTPRLTVREFIAAMAGLGLPEEIDASLEVVDAMLKSCTVTKFRLSRSSHPKRSLLTELELSNGTTLHLAAGAEGPTIYKITRRKDGCFDLEFQENTENDSLRLGSGEVAGGGDPTGDGSTAVGSSVGEPASPAAGISDLLGRIQETEG